MTLASGTRLNIYEILAPIGAGGMGEVYRVRDTKLGREVAIKVLPEAFSRDKERMARFEREAKLLASLNHANIATLYGLEESDGQLYLAMELVEGETLAERIARGPIPIDEAILLFVQIAEGLEAAHDKGVVHRDLKPANIKITPEGKIKILDFGLAKAFLPEENVSEESAPTLTKGTQLGAIIGTPSYMSPEQARGKSVDRRSDIWAFGCCLHEALTGKKTFQGETVTDVLAAVVQREPDWNKLPRETPVSLRRALSRSLQKDPGLRFHHIADARIELIDRGSEQPLTAAGSRMTWPRFTYALTAVVAISAILIGWPAWFFSPPPPVILPDGQELPDAYARVFVMSPDGRQLVYLTGTSDRTQFCLRALDDRYVPTGHVVYAHAGQLLAAPFDLDELELGGIAPSSRGRRLHVTHGPRLLRYFRCGNFGLRAERRDQHGQRSGSGRPRRKRDEDSREREPLSQPSLLARRSILRNDPALG